MRGKSLLILILIFIMLGGLFYFIYQKSTEKIIAQDKTIGALFPELDFGAIKRVFITDGKKDVSLIDKDGVWVAENKDGYPIKYSRLAQLLDSLIGITSFEEKTDNPKYFEGLGVAVPNENSKKTTMIVFKDRKDNELTGLILGHGRKKRLEENQGVIPELGQYIRKDNNNQVYYIKDKINVDSEVLNWLNKDIVNVVKVDVKEVSLKHEDKKNDLIITREKKEDEFKVVGQIPKDKEVNKNTVNAISNVFQYLNFDDVFAKDKPIFKDLKFTNECIVTLFDGTVYTAELLKQGDNYYLTIAVEKTAVPVEVVESESQTEEKAAGMTAEEIAEQNQKFAPWVYVISKYKGDNMAKRFNEVLEDKQKEEK